MEQLWGLRVRTLKASPSGSELFRQPFTDTERKTAPFYALLIELGQWGGRSYSFQCTRLEAREARRSGGWFPMIVAVGEPWFEPKRENRCQKKTAIQMTPFPGPMDNGRASLAGTHIHMYMSSIASGRAQVENRSGHALSLAGKATGRTHTCHILRIRRVWLPEDNARRQAKG